MTSDDIIDHTSQIDLRPNDFDWSRFLNNSVYPQLFEFSRWEWAQANNIAIEHSNIAAVVVRMEVDYITPVMWSPTAKVLVKTRLENMGKFSILLSQTVCDMGGDDKARGSIKLALYDFDEHRIKPTSILNTLRTPS